MGDTYYFVTSTGPALAGQGMGLHGAPQSVAFPAPVQDGQTEVTTAFDGSSNDFDYACADTEAENGHQGSQQWAYQVPYSESWSSDISDAELTDTDGDMANSFGDFFQDFPANGNFERAGSPYQLLQDERNPGATWVEGPPEGATFGYHSGSEMVGFNGIFSESSNSEPVFEFAQVQSFAAADVQPEVPQIPNRDQRAQRRAELLAQMKQISQELIEFEALDAA
ncbi:hypothetical protein KC330_g3492 [Hortaea werneckii]|nr:hypothetical protein KC330_g3492 [Hortaea werneckii]